MLFVIASIFVLYTVLLLLLVQGIKKILQQKPVPDAHQLRVLSVVVPFRNEAGHLGALVNDLKSQTYPPFSYEVILVNDHSTDGSYELLQRLTQGDPRFRLASLAAGVIGKKAALTEAIRVSQGEIILTTDADCRLPETWCRAMNAQFERSAVKMCLGPVCVQGGASFFQTMQSLEFVSVVAVTMATLGWGRPILAGGANLAFRKDAFYAVDGYFDERTLASGDDQFLMEKISRRFAAPVAYAADKNALVVTRPAADVRTFLRQRLRWAGKWAHVQPATRAFAVFIFLFHVAAFASVPVAVSVCFGGETVAALWVMKALAEGVLLRPVARFTKSGWNWAAFACWQLAYPLYAISVALFSRRNEVHWKDRVWQNQV